MEGQKSYGHEHLLMMLNEEQLINNGSGVGDCSRCGEKVTAPCFSCTENCGFYLHKICADAPSELDHPFHRQHPLALLQNSPSRCVCDFCDQTCEKSIYHCSCGLHFHIKCALFTFNIAGKNSKELEHVTLEDPLMYNLHKKYAELPLKVNHMCHRKHPLVLQFNSKQLSCKICQTTPHRGLVYGCSPCEFTIHIECASPLPVIEDKSHQHPFTLFWRQVPFICDACGTEGHHVSYTCGTCSIMVHKKCISLPRIIKHRWHHHRVFHTYSLHKEHFTSLDCMFCHDAVDTEHGSYFCAGCNVIFHVNCAMKNEDWYSIVSEDDDESLDISVNSITNVLERNDAGEATLIEHFKHNHYLMLSDKIREYDDKCCDGCLLPISGTFYQCLQCDFFLHKACAELPKMKLYPSHLCELKPLILTSDMIFKCELCEYLSNGFSYECKNCGQHTCLRCITLDFEAVACSGHEHPLLFYYGFEEQCRSCGRDIKGAFRCKDCNFHIDHLCARKPTRVRHRCDEHLLALTYHEVNDYSEYLTCDICEKRRDPKHWFYHCATCDTSAHMDCVLGEDMFFKLGSSYKDEDHPHTLTFVRKIYEYPECDECGEHCQDLALECPEPGCNYIAHWKCLKTMEPVMGHGT